MYISRKLGVGYTMSVLLNNKGMNKTGTLARSLQLRTTHDVVKPNDL
jgi:hypothetical protein